MTRCRLSNAAKEDLIRIYHFGILRFGETQADLSFEEFFRLFEKIDDNHYSYESVNHIKESYRKCPCGSDTIYFRISYGCIEIMAIIGKQDLKNIFK